jgi:alkanesulfonate monooxygenase SsuD/methylene tetrahydromethanopterin reductase-like flavin-dependent oxidoreductase (luciferase family)
MKLGVMLPNFETHVEPSLEFALEAERIGLHGVFCFDHLWPMGRPGLPALSPFPLLSAISSLTSTIALGTLVARVGLEPDDVLVSQFSTLQELSGRRVIAGLGTGDHKSDGENVAFGFEIVPAEDRRERLEGVASALMARGFPTWIGAGAPETNEIARRLGCTLNIWAGGAGVFTRLAAEPRVSWGGEMPGSVEATVAKFAALEAAGATWAVISWHGPFDGLVEAAKLAGIELAGRDS